MSRIRQESVAEQVYRLLQADIEAGRFRPGQRIFEDELAEELGVSTTPLRLALHQLNREGVVRIEPRRGTYLAAPTWSEVVELIELREVIEGLAARRAALRKDKRYLDEMAALMATFDEGTLHSRRADYAAADQHFHALLARASGSDQLVQTLKSIRLRTHVYRLVGLRESDHDLRPIHAEHLKIIEVLAAGDPVGAEETLRAHVRRQLGWTSIKDGKPGAADIANSGYERSQRSARKSVSS